MTTIVSSETLYRSGKRIIVQKLDSFGRKWTTSFNSADADKIARDWVPDFKSVDEADLLQHLHDGGTPADFSLTNRAITREEAEDIAVQHLGRASTEDAASVSDWFHGLTGAQRTAIGRRISASGSDLAALLSRATSLKNIRATLQADSRIAV